MADTLQAGDTVALKSNPKIPMTIEWIDRNEACCAWFHPLTGDYQQRKFFIVALQKIAV